MKKFLLAVGLFLGSLLPSVASEADVKDTISQQIEAFKVDDFSKAFTFASPMIKGMFGGNPQAFGMMVQRGYPMVHRPADVQFLETEDKGGSIHQKVQIVDQNGNFHLLDYQMINSENGWKINGVQLLEAPGVGV